MASISDQYNHKVLSNIDWLLKQLIAGDSCEYSDRDSDPENHEYIPSPEDEFNVSLQESSAS